MVSSRSKATAEAAANKRATRSAVASGAAPKLPDVSTSEQEKKKAAASKKPAVKPTSSKPDSYGNASSKASAKTRKKGGGGYCLCNGEDDGSPMIKCEGECQNWYHFHCVELDEDTAGEIEKYYCPDCETKTGLKTVMDFEGGEAFVNPPPPSKALTKKGRNKTPDEVVEVVDSPEESDDAGSGDDYVAESFSRKIKAGKKPMRRLSSSPDNTEEDDEDDASDVGHRRRPSKGGRLKRLKKVSASPTPESSSVHKRRSSSAQHPVQKRSKTVESAHDDAIRKYCLAKLEEIIRPMFEEHRNSEGASQSGDKEVAQEGTEKAGAQSSSTETEQDDLDQKVKSFVTELERCMMETYAEPDKTGKPSAGGKYKERFRMLQFNLPKRDRVAVRKGIASGRITPAQLNVMSSTDLADEQTKHEIEVAEKEALEHSILQKITAPRAKITHKGLETIEDVSGQRAADAAKEEEERRMEMEKREREKLARLRSLSIQQKSPTSATEQSPLSATFPKTSSPTMTRPTGSEQPWGAPPPPPGQTRQTSMPPASPSSSKPAVRPLFMPSIPSTSNDQSSLDQGLSLDDIMNIDDDSNAKEAPSSNPQQRMSAQVNAEAGPSSSPVITTPSGPSPFAPSKSSADSAKRPSFDLNSLWTGSGEQAPTETIGDNAREDTTSTDPVDTPAPENTEDAQDDAMDLDSNDDDDERSLDAILEQSANTVPIAETSTAQPASSLESLPEVWSGQIAMPRENFDALMIDVTCKQTGGRGLEPGSEYWRMLFPSPQARIDGRVPTGQSTKYLVSVRMNSTKELIVVAFMPRSDEAKARFNELIDFLLAKDRHALIFPWGTHPRPEAPGRELYIIPVLKDQPLPEFIELMDDHQVPRERSSNMLIGAFVLNKGKLTAATPPPASVTPVPISSPFPSVSNVPVQIPGIPKAPIPSIPAVSQSPSVPAPPAAGAPQAKIDQSALAAEVASLTPEQISLMLRHLQQSVPIANPVGAASQIPISTPPQSVPVPTFSMPGMPPFPPQFPPTNQPHVQSPVGGQFSPPRQFSPPHPQGERHFDEMEERHRDFGRGSSRGRGSDRGKRGYKGRGKPFHDDRGHRSPAADNGWRGRNRENGQR